ncbi:lipopolysaccharide biosynthesis protein [Legionella hackeliae]|uniref:Polysaccharide biosynthesis protein n=1 Tax=Legionella hackeliae TaxID=449 RepID=A0A0A8URU7_LEGHA|nr:membrane protein [Legionella hackeliae]KTD08803.1 hypothetical protein Lhac_3026 [Legionella hackeliae]CEK10231.1 membrane protein of unknown function [Legionella hackeliae]STX46960.1 Uncharacterised protein [Legionella hackeliae]
MSKHFNNFIQNDHVKKFLAFSIGSLGGMFFSFCATFFLNGWLSKEQMGSYSYTFNLLNFIYPVISLSVFSGYARFINLYQIDLLVNFVQKISWLSTLFFTIVISAFLSNGYYLLFAFIVLFQERLMLARAKLEIARYNYLNVLQKVLFLIFVLCFRNELNAEKALFYLGSSYLIAYLASYLWKETIYDRPVDSAVDKKVFLQFCVITMLTMIVHWLLTVSDQVIIKYYYGYEVLAPYAVAYRIVTMLSLISGIFLTYYPNVYFREISGEKVGEVFQLRKFFIGALVAATVGLLLFKDIVYIIFGARNYIDQSGYFVPLLLGEMLRTIASILMTFLTFKLQQKNILLSLLFISILNVILNILLVPSFGPMASAYCTLLCFSLYLVVSFFTSFIPEAKYVAQERLGINVNG